MPKKLKEGERTGRRGTMVYEYKGVDGLEKHLKDKSYVTGREPTPSSFQRGREGRSSASTFRTCRSSRGLTALHADGVQAVPGADDLHDLAVDAALRQAEHLLEDDSKPSASEGGKGRSSA